MFARGRIASPPPPLVAHADAKTEAVNQKSNRLECFMMLLDHLLHRQIPRPSQESEISSDTKTRTTAGGAPRAAATSRRTVVRALLGSAESFHAPRRRHPVSRPRHCCDAGCGRCRAL